MSIFTKVSKPRVKSSNFNLSEEVKLSCNFGDLVPILVKETLPGDIFKINTELAIKFAPLKAPVMHKINAYIHYFYVPNFQISKVFADFINPKVNTSSNPVVLPYMTPLDLTVTEQIGIGSLADYLGLPITQFDSTLQTNEKLSLSILPFLCYQHIYNEYYRDQNLEPIGVDGDESFGPLDIAELMDYQGRLDYEGDSGENLNRLVRLTTLRKRAWAKDYFTSALPSPQAGDDVLLPLSTTGLAPDGPMTFEKYNPYGGGGALPEGDAVFDNGPVSPAAISYLGVNDLTSFYQAQYVGGLKVGTQSATINDLRRAMALQKFKELAERGGSRYSEMVSNFFNTYLPDFMVDRPIYLGGQVQPIQISEMFQTAPTSGSSIIGDRSGIGESYGRSKTVKFKCPAHGFVMGILSIRPEATYQQGLERMWTRQSIFDFAFPQFAHMGEQEIYNREIFLQGTDDDDGVFGYTPRYAEYKESHCHVCGEFRTSLDYWHFGRTFENLPTLSKEFVAMDGVDYDPFNVVSGQTEHVYVDCYNHIMARRPLPYFGSPGVI